MEIRPDGLAIISIISIISSESVSQYFKAVNCSVIRINDFKYNVYNMIYRLFQPSQVDKTSLNTTSWNQFLDFFRNICYRYGQDKDEKS